MSAAISLVGVSVRQGGAVVLDGVSLDVGAGELLSLLGRSGSGKSTMLRVIAGLAIPHLGEVRVGGRTMSRSGTLVVPPEERGVSVVFQDLALWPHLTVHGNLEFGLKARAVPRAEREARIGAMLGLVGLAGKSGRHPGELSGGERQRVAIARALVLEPAAVLLDEPLSNLDRGLRRDLLEHFRALLVGSGTTAIHVTHEPRDAEALGGRVAVLDGGRIRLEGGVEVLRAAEDLLTAS